ncbi:hypothetical protein TSUD_43460 [Trifolium subterraneum]|uniref:Uncharacterized protein n=1 Tax=Trifolium subterraneum TaxID=3900 RepID=A0A2Z6MRL6_TRISU|nr:hypothetical protein TSUD_43460 [Trifolium subterraneum]
MQPRKISRLKCLSFEVFLAAPCGTIGAFVMLIDPKELQSVFQVLVFVYFLRYLKLGVTLLSSQRTDT